MRIEKRDGEDYNIYIISIVNFDASSAAVRSLRWYAEFVSRGLDRARFSVCLTHRSCVLRVKLNESEYNDGERRNLIVKFGEEWVSCVKGDFEMLADGRIPQKIKNSYLEENKAIFTEWNKCEEHILNGKTDKTGYI